MCKYLSRNKIAVTLLSMLFTVLLTSCAVVKATNQPRAKDLSVLNNGTPRAHVIAELGQPVETEIKRGKKVDIFSFVQGYSPVTKTVRAVGHGVADVFTLGLWEVAGTPIEGLANGHLVQVEIYYNAENNVEHVNVIKGKDAQWALDKQQRQRQRQQQLARLEAPKHPQQKAYH